MRTGLIYGCGGLILLGLALGLFVPGSPWPSVVLGVAAGGLMGVVSWFTTSRTVQAEEPSVAWIALDYGAKIAVTIAALAVAKASASLDVIVVAALVIAAIALTAIIQVVAFTPARTRVVIHETDDA